ncbi:lytic murein transglycosylase B [Thioalkalicoccus limnaeus]|uniref:Lytic murein transglycosylase B n=2 Tax=Thioalkalicoccus limnaeus TaxID=120681 RepID=A0ABV4BCQ0_9GAMM
MVLALAAIGPPVASTEIPEAYAAGRQAFIGEVAERHGFDRASLTDLLDQARYDPAIIAAITRPFEARPWPEYRALFVTSERIARGVEYWAAHEDWLRRAEADYGVPPQIIVAIIGVETNYGANLGRHRVIDSLTTLGFSYPPRADFFRRELEELLLLAREERIDLTSVTGSYAGAMGKPQFISSSYRAYAIDFDGDGRRDLWNSDADAIGSVANYLHRHGWRRDAAVAVPARVPPGGAAPLPLAEGGPLSPAIPASVLREAGIAWHGHIDEEAPSTLMRLPGGVDEYWLGQANFYALTRYNRSNLYAMAVAQLADEIRVGRLAR